MFIKGVGMTKFGYHDKLTHMIGYEAIKECLADSDLKIKDIDCVVASTLEFWFTGEKQRHFASLLSGLLKTRVPIIRVPAACAGSGTAFWTANRIMQNSEYNNILVLGVEKLLAKNSSFVTEEFGQAAEQRLEQPAGLIFPGENALVAQAYLNEFPDTTTDDLAMIALKNHENAFNNPKAYFYKKKMDLEKIKQSPIVASPLRLLDCSVSVDGAAAVALTKDKTDIEVVGSGLTVDYMAPFERDSLTTWQASVDSAKIAYEQAGISANDIDFAEVHDAFTIVELLAYEDLGFAKKGEGAKLIRDGTVKIDGKLPINSCGGLKAKGHPVSATGCAQINEIVRQMRKECNERQISRTNYGLAQNIGGAGSTIAVNIFKNRKGG